MYGSLRHKWRCTGGTRGRTNVGNQEQFCFAKTLALNRTVSSHCTYVPAMHCCQSSALKWMSLHLVAFHWFGFAWSCLFASGRVMRVARRLPFSSTVQCISLQTKALPSGTMGDLVKLRIWEQQARATPHHPPYLLPFMSPPRLPQYRTEKKELNLSWSPNPRMTQGSPRLIRIPIPPICYCPFIKGGGALNPSFSGRGRTPLPGKLFIVVQLFCFVLRFNIHTLTM